MRKLALTLAVSITLCLVAAASSAVPSTGPFAGTTSLHAINGFHDLITFTSAAGGRQLRKFQFGTLGCFGLGGFPVGTDPYGVPENTASMKPVPVSARGAILVMNAPATLPASDGTVTTATIKATFTNARTISGTITVSQTDAQGDKCGPATMKFTAMAGTASSLGLTGP